LINDLLLPTNHYYSNPCELSTLSLNHSFKIYSLTHIKNIISFKFSTWCNSITRHILSLLEVKYLFLHKIESQQKTKWYTKQLFYILLSWMIKTAEWVRWKKGVVACTGLTERFWNFEVIIVEPSRKYINKDFLKKEIKCERILFQH